MVKMNADSKVVIDGFLLEPRLVKRLTEHNKSIFLYADENTIRNSFFARADKQDVLGVINTLSDPVKTREHVLEMVCKHSARKRAEAKAAGARFLVRNGATDLQESLIAVEQHFGLI